MDAKIVISLDIEKAKEQILSEIESKLIKTYENEEFKVEDAKAVLREAYIAEESYKYLIIKAVTYRIEAQNALLKLLEEPPRNIVFILIAKSKTAFLPTIRSRMQIRHIDVQKIPFKLDIDVARMELADIFTFLQQNRNITKQVLKETIETLLKVSLIEAKIDLFERELRLFDHALVLAELNTRAQTILSTLLLTLYHARSRRQR